MGVSTERLLKEPHQTISLEEGKRVGREKKRQEIITDKCVAEGPSYLKNIHQRGVKSKETKCGEVCET